jgi:Endosomal/lysosomal potassium channel TMEM175
MCKPEQTDPAHCDVLPRRQRRPGHGQRVTAWRPIRLGRWGGRTSPAVSCDVAPWLAEAFRWTIAVGMITAVADEETTSARAPGLSTARMEAFSDGVFAIAITLLVLEIGVPSGSEGDLARGLADQWPSYLAYLVSFSTIGLSGSHTR